MKNLWLILLVCLIGCSAKKKPVAATPAARHRPRR